MTEPKPPTSDADEPESAREPAVPAKRRTAAGAPAGRKRPRAAEEASASRDDGDDEADDAEGDDESEAEGEEGEEGEGGQDAAEAKEAAAPPNRHERRRRKVKGDDEDVRDRNARLRQQLRQKRAAETERVNLAPLSTGEMVDDVLARGMASFGKWARKNANNIQTALGLLILAGGAYGIYSWRTTSNTEESSSALFQGVSADRGRVLEKDAPAPKAEEEIYPVYRDPNERVTTALAAYRTTTEKFGGSGAAILARLGEAGILLDKRAYDDALKAYTDVRNSALGQADVDVKGRAFEGVGFALEGKGDQEGALKAFHDLESVSGFKELAFYHQARLNAAKGDKAKALEFVRSARESLAAATPEGKAQRAFVSEALDELHRSLDPASAPPKMPLGGLGGPGGPQISPEDLLRLQEQLKGAGGP